MRRFFLSLLVVLMLFGGVGVAPVSANRSCDCFCTSSSGAVDTQKSLTQAECSAECDARGGRVAAWACSANQYPSRSLNCFTADQCLEHGGNLDSKYQPPECPTGMHYCYPDESRQEAVDLAVSIGGLTSTKDLGEYMSSAYTWLVGAMTTLAIVMIMIQGLRYSFGAVNASAISAAKTKIRSLVIGLVLLLSTVLILATINPQLLKLDVPDFPMVKTVSLVDNASCDDLIREGYQVDYSGPEECGTVGTVTVDPAGNNVSDGTVCNFEKCSGAQQLCVPGDTPTCMECHELTSNNTVVQASPSLCAGFNALPQYVSMNQPVPTTGQFTLTAGPDAGTTRPYTYDQIRQVHQCFFTRDPDAGGEPVGRGACANISFQCKGVTSCQMYDKIQVTGSSTTSLDNIDLGKGSGLTGTSASETVMSQLGDVTMGQICTADPCGWARTESTKGCYVDYGSVAAITAGSVADVVSAASVYSYDCSTTPDTSGWYYDIGAALDSLF